MYFIGIDISKYKHDCFIVSSDGEAPFGVFSFENNKQGFHLKQICIAATLYILYSIFFTLSS